MTLEQPKTPSNSPSQPQNDPGVLPKCPRWVLDERDVVETQEFRRFFTGQERGCGAIPAISRLGQHARQSALTPSPAKSAPIDVDYLQRACLSHPLDDTHSDFVLENGTRIEDG